MTTDMEFEEFEQDLETAFPLSEDAISLLEAAGGSGFRKQLSF